MDAPLTLPNSFLLCSRVGNFAKVLSELESLPELDAILVFHSFIIHMSFPSCFLLRMLDMCIVIVVRRVHVHQLDFVLRLFHWMRRTTGPEACTSFLFHLLAGVRLALEV